MQTLVDGQVYALRRGFFNMYVLVNGDSITLVDTLTSAQTVDSVRQELAQHGLDFARVRQVFITHAHYDHVGGLTALQAALNVRTIAHRREAPIVRGEQPVARPRPQDVDFLSRLILASVNFTITPARVDTEVQEGAKLDEVLPGIEVIELPGHTYGQIGLWWPEKRLLLGGDVMMHLPWGLTMPFRLASPDWAAAKDSVRKVAALDVEVLGLGHGPAIMGGAAAKVRALLK